MNWLSNLFGLFAKSNPLRPLLAHIASQNVSRIVEIGLGDATRTVEMLQRAKRSAGDEQVSYTGIDLFDASESSLTLKAAHQQLQPLGAEVRLVPGNARLALTRSANELRGTDLVVISAGDSAEGLEHVWHLVHRMLHKESQVWVEQSPEEFEVLSVSDVTSKMLAAQQKKRRAA